MCGPIHRRSMWMVERHLKSLKDSVRQRAHPEGSMCLFFYKQGLSMKFILVYHFT
jgi:hypothetical protein